MWPDNRTASDAHFMLMNSDIMTIVYFHKYLYVVLFLLRENLLKNTFVLKFFKLWKACIIDLEQLPPDWYLSNWAKLAFDCMSDTFKILI